MSTCANCGNELRTCGKCGFSKVYEEDLMHLKREIEQLKEANATLLECVKWYADSENYAPKFYIGDDPDLPDEIESAIDADYGERASECLKQIGSDNR